MRAPVACALVLLATVAGADEHGRIRGRVFVRGSIAALPGAVITSPYGETIADDEGRFTVDLPVGPVELVISAPGHTPLRVAETVRAAEGVSVEYRLLPQAGWRRRLETTVRGEARHEGQRFTLREDELQRAPGALGDPFRVVGLLPGVATPIPLLPVYVIRGASPGMNGFFLDGMRVPQLFHFLVGGGVVHPRLVDRLDFYPGAYDSSFGRYAGGIIDAETRPARDDAWHAEAELRLYDASALVEAKLPAGVRVALAGHYGYPGPIIHLAEPNVDVSYWDYQLRLDWRGLTLEALGSYDSVVLGPGLLRGGASRVADDYSVMFHRLQLRERARFGAAFLEAALDGGYDRVVIFGGYGVEKIALGGRLVLHLRAAKWLQIDAGLDGELSRFTPANFPTDNGPAAPDQLGELGAGRSGAVGGGFVQATAEVIPRRLTATFGTRVDAYHAGSVTLLGVDPRLNLRARLFEQLAITVGVGLYQQPPSFPVALPGIDTFALQLGLQRAWQGATTIEAKLPWSSSFTVTGYYERFANINDVLIDFATQVCTSAPPESLTGAVAFITRQVDGQSYGLELLLRRHTGRFTGWIAYTLSRSERVYSCGLRPSDTDQSHVLNLVAQLRLPWNLLASGRFYFASGRPFTRINVTEDFQIHPMRNNDRLPDYAQLDLRIDREWIFARWALSIFLEVVNVTYGRTIFTVSYPTTMGITRYDQPQLNGLRWILPSLGVRGRF